MAASQYNNVIILKYLAQIWENVYMNRDSENTKVISIMTTAFTNL